ncbi:hypothetical protein [Salinibacter ruber]|jgi:hypothetical protein|uniref:Uncharacterized protein n=1 Tax=Salinibacter ruber TaxID=146919 RepID=A0AAW5PDW4_9BACT|nr:hypothetical protein [Salinibacter ruber]MCS4159421.1 hypothetical protein [Salinibacter ruber]MCS4223685.1 hypothetical protein [Salinibacter ruber]
MKLTQELREQARANADDPRALLEILRDLTTWSDEEIAGMQRAIIDQVTQQLETSFPWPETNAPTGDGSIDPGDWPDIGLLGKLGYEVGKGGKNKYRRRAILRKAFQADASEWLPIEDQAEQWGEPTSSKRLQKIANSLAAFATNAKKKDPSLETAISHWEADLAHLKEQLYDEQYSFEWPKAGAADTDGDDKLPKLPFGEKD